MIIFKKNNEGMEFLRNFPRQYLNTDSFHLHLCPYFRGEENAARQ